MPSSIRNSLKQQKFLSLLFRPTTAWKAIFSWIGFLSLFLLAGLGKFLILLFPLSSVAVGLFLYFRAPALYIGFTFWIWFFGALIRRIIDYQSGYLTPGPWTFTPLLVTMITYLTIVRELPKIRNYKQNLPFIICFGALAYAFLIGLIQHPLDTTIVNFLDWVCPMSFGFYLYVNWKNYPQYRQVIQQSFLWGIIFTGLYGIIQFCTAPPWEQFWFDMEDVKTFGVAEPFGIRVMSSMNSPQAFATMMMAGLILLFSDRSKTWFLPANILGYLSFLLSRARAAWMGWLISLFIFVSSAKSSTQMKIIVSITLIVLVMLPLINLEPFSDTIMSRLETLSNTETDTSLNTRLSAYEDLFGLAIQEVVGKGLGYKIDLAGFGENDGAILPTLFIFGWLGIIPLLSGVGVMLFKLFYAKINKSDAFSVATKAICVGILAQIGFNYIFSSTIGLIFWSFLGISLASQKHYLFQLKSALTKPTT
ncbi:O-antigen ligase domain-containing protein [Myxosarcina sp. GI1(2024)]